jgi:hypothetical protein
MNWKRFQRCKVRWAFVVLSLNRITEAPLLRTFAALCRPFRCSDLHTVELDMKLIDIRQTGLAQNRLLYVVFFVLRSILNVKLFMFSYYGSKSKIVDLYPPPKHGKIIEPFAGSARYSLKYFDKDVLLVDKYDVIVRIWKWLQQCSAADILKLPEPKLGEKINRDNFDCIEASWLVGFLIQQGVARPGLTASKFSVGEMPGQKKRIASQLFKIKHWTIKQGCYMDLENEQATWFVDPPYEVGGYKYKHCQIDFKKLAEWCKSRDGQTIVCENSQATWLPFTPMVKIQGVNNFNPTEVIWSNHVTNYDNVQMGLF